MNDDMDYVSDYFKVNYPNRGADSIKEKLKNILDTAKTQTKSGVVKIPIIFGDNGAVEYYETLTSIKEEIKNFKARLLTIENLQQCILNSTTINESKEHQTSLNKIVRALDKTAKNIYERLKNLSVSNERLVKKNGYTEDVKERIKQHSYATKLLIHLTSEYRTLLNNYNQKYRERIKRHIQITCPEATEHEIETITSNVEASGNKNNPLSALVSQQYINDELERANIQNRELLELESNVTDLYNLFNEMSTMLTVQSENLTNSEHYIQKAGKNSNVGMRELNTGVKYYKRSKKKIMYITISLVTLLFIIMAMSMIRLQF